jgi:LPS export ABC transporter protein LptC
LLSFFRPLVSRYCPQWGLGLALLLLGLTACQPPDPSVKVTPSSTPTVESHLTLNKATLEQSNNKGQTLWKIQVQEAIYTPDRKNAKLSQLKGDLYNNGKIVLKVVADRGEIQQDGELVILQDNILAIDPRNKVVIRSPEVEWRPKESIMVIRKGLKGNHPELEVTSQEGSYDTQQQQLTLMGKIVGLAEKKQLTLKTEALRWLVPQHKIISDRRMEISRFKGKEITDQVTTLKAEIQLDRKIVLIQDNLEFKSLKPPLQLAGKVLEWHYQDRIVTSSQPLQILDYQNKITVTGNQGKVDLNQNMAWLTGGTQSQSEQNQSQLFADQLTWNMQAQTIEGLGNIIYQQDKGVKFNLTGDKAIGSLQNNSVIVTSNQPERVVTEIYPSPK